MFDLDAVASASGGAASAERQATAGNPGVMLDGRPCRQPCMAIEIRPDDPRRAPVQQLLHAHLAQMHAQTPIESVHALDIEALCDPRVRFMSASLDGELVACGALYDHGAGLAEIKSMHTRAASRGRGVGGAILQHLIDTARAQSLRELVLETGSTAEFEPARSLYRAAGFVECPPFADYQPDPLSTFMRLVLR